MENLIRYSFDKFKELPLMSFDIGIESFVAKMIESGLTCNEIELHGKRLVDSYFIKYSPVYGFFVSFWEHYSKDIELDLLVKKRLHEKTIKESAKHSLKCVCLESARKSFRLLH